MELGELVEVMASLGIPTDDLTEKSMALTSLLNNAYSVDTP